MNEIERDVSIEQVDYNVDINTENYSIDILSQPTFELQLNEQGPQGARGYTGNGIAMINLEYQRANIDVYRILMTDGEEYHFSVTNGLPGTTGNGIDHIEKTGSSGNVDTYTIFYTDGTDYTFDVTNGVNGADGVGVDSVTLDYTSGLDKYYHMNFTDGLYYEYVVTDGKDGTNGVDGYSPTATVSKSGDTATISITDKNGTTTATIKDGARGATGETGNGIDRIDLTGYSSDMLTKYYRMWFTNLEYFDFSITDGKNGTNGTNGTNGADGYSPTATVTQTSTGATISITDKNGTTTANVLNGTDGANGTNGQSASITGATASVTNTVGTPSVTVTSGGTALARSFNFAFSNLKGDKGEKGDPGEVTTAQLQDALDDKQDVLTAGTDLEIVQGSILPNTYTQLTSITSTGTQWINSGIKLTNSFKSIIVGRLTGTPTTNFRTILGANNSNLSQGKQNVLLGWGNSANGFYAEPCTMPSYTYSSYPWDTNTHTFITNVTPTVTTLNIDGVVDTINSAPSITEVNLAIFARLAQNGTVGSQVNFELNSIELYQSGSLVFKGVPAKRNSDDEVGLYDTVSSSFFPNSGTGDFIAGNVVSHSNNTVINFTNDSGYITGIDSTDVTDALGYTPANANSIGNGTVTITQGGVTKGTFTLNQSGNVTINLDAGGGGTITVDQVYDSTSANAQSGVAIAGAGFLTSISSSDVTTALGYTPYNSTNPNGYITSSALNGYATQTWVGQQGYLTSSSISNMQTTGNLVTSISSSSTDSQYPSAKCMYDIIGDIETLLQAV